MCEGDPLLGRIAPTIRVNAQTACAKHPPRLVDPDATLKSKIVEFVTQGDFGLASGKKTEGAYERRRVPLGLPL
jgi:hypothetical protein